MFHFSSLLTYYWSDGSNYSPASQGYNMPTTMVFGGGDGRWEKDECAGEKMKKRKRKQ